MTGNIIIIALIFGAIALLFGNIYIGAIGVIAFLYQIYKDDKKQKEYSKKLKEGLID